MRRIARSAIVECSARQVYDLVEDIESYPEFLPWCVAAHVRERVPARTVATLEVGMPGIRQSFTTENTNAPGKSIDMRLLQGPFRRFEAHWKFTALGAAATRIEFAIAYEFADRILAKALEPLFDQIAGTMVDAFTRRAERLYAKPAR
jgi:ribosome-associated toxin RatA of RatAB toxin-antitoxin module